MPLPPAAESFDAVYRGEREFTAPPWDIGEPQPAFVRLHAAGQIRGRVLDAGCGTGTLARYLAGQGLDVVGFDFAPTAVELARRRAAEQQLDVDFVVVDVSSATGYEEQFDTVLDCALLHALEEPERGRYLRGLHGMTRPGGLLHVLTFSERVPDFVDLVRRSGPRRATRDGLCGEVTAAGWRVCSVEASGLVGQVAEHARVELPSWLLTACRPQ